ncbi:MAG: TPM domain-containing protein [Clostridia bacterium]|nr:TPM domain-containing protein [Clostridia bacterium]
MKKIFSVLLAALFLLAFPCSAAIDIPDATNNFFVADYADVISSADELHLHSAAENLYSACKAQVVVATMPSLEGEEISDVSLRIARAWGIGDKELDNGILLLFVREEPRVRIEVGSGLEGAIPDSKAGRLLDTYMLPAYPDYSTGLRQTQNALINEIYIEYGLTPDKDYTPIQEQDSEELGLFEIIGLVALIIGGIILFIKRPDLFFLLLHILSRSGGRNGSSGQGRSGGGGGFSGGGASR